MSSERFGGAGRKITRGLLEGVSGLAGGRLELGGNFAEGSVSTPALSHDTGWRIIFFEIASFGLTFTHIFIL